MKNDPASTERLVFLATTTRLDGDADNRKKLALSTCKAARGRYPIIVVDDSQQAFRDELTEAGAMVVPQQKRGMGEARRQCLKAALDRKAEIVIWLEPEKHSLVPLLTDCVNQVAGGAHIVVPRRKHFENYPRYQQWSELLGNWQLGSLTGRFDIDFFFGPRVLSRQAAIDMAAYDGRFGDKWHILFIPLLKYIDEIKCSVVNYVHPVEQASEDDSVWRIKRDQQRVELVAAMELAKAAN